MSRSKKKRRELAVVKETTEVKEIMKDIPETRLEKLCMQTQEELKVTLPQELMNAGYHEILVENGYIYAKGDVPVLLVAHMDTVHKIPVIKLNREDNKLSSPQGIGGDDRCGIYMILEIIKDRKCSVLFCEDEEIGALGSTAFTKTELINNLNVNYMIEIDRKGENDAVFYSCDNPKFTNFVCDATIGFKMSYGSFTDISTLMPASGIAGVNISSGYYNAHTTKEYIVLTQVERNIERIIKLIDKPCEEPFEYIKSRYKDYTYGYGSGYDYGYGCYDDYDDYYLDDRYNRQKKSSYTSQGTILKTFGYTTPKPVVVRFDYWDDTTKTIKAGFGRGATARECLADFMVKNDEVCVANITSWKEMGV